MFHYNAPLSSQVPLWWTTFTPTLHYEYDIHVPLSSQTSLWWTTFMICSIMTDYLHNTGMFHYDGPLPLSSLIPFWWTISLHIQFWWITFIPSFIMMDHFLPPVTLQWITFSLCSIIMDSFHTTLHYNMPPSTHVPLWCTTFIPSSITMYHFYPKFHYDGPVSFQESMMDFFHYDGPLSHHLHYSILLSSEVPSWCTTFITSSIMMNFHPKFHYDRSLLSNCLNTKNHAHFHFHICTHAWTNSADLDQNTP